MRKYVILMILICIIGQVFATRKALLIGNADYGKAESNLRNPVNDVNLLEVTLKAKGFIVSKAVNANRRDIRSIVQEFSEGVNATDEVIFYYSGHGAQVNGINYLIPVGADIRDEVDCEDGAVTANWVLGKVSSAKTSIFILDACRNNPFFKPKGEAVKGLAAMKTTAQSQLILYATEDNKVAKDGSGINSPFVETLVSKINSSDQKLQDMLPEIKTEVLKKTNGEQSPTAYGILLEPFYFVSNNTVKPDLIKKENTTKPTIEEVETTYVKGKVSIESNTQGKIFIDGTEVTSINIGEIKTYSLVIGEHKIALQYGGKTDTKNIIVKNDQTINVEWNLLPVKGGGSVADGGLAGMVYVAGGTFTMGDTFGYGGSDQNPAHSVTLSSFYIGKYEVTQKQWQDVMGSNPSKFKGDNLPVEKVFWYDTIEFCNKLSQREGLTPYYNINKNVKDTNNQNSDNDDSYKWTVTCNWQANGYRLPTEAEWEYASRGGSKSKGYIYSGSNTIERIAWYNNNSNGKTRPVGTKKANELGIYDMTGNVCEWCWDWYDSQYYGKSPASDPQGAGAGDHRVLRGGSWDDYPVYCGVFYRYYDIPVGRYYSVGIRLCRAKF